MTATAPAMSERDFDQLLFGTKRGLAPSLGWGASYHTLYAKGSAPGFPDRVLVRNRIIYAELKRDGGKPTDKQTEWLDRLVRAGGECYLWRPGDLDEIARVLSGGWQYRRQGQERVHTYEPAGTPPFLYTLGSAGAVFMPASMWTVDGRRDERRET